jgi:shikimate dehydrogenase
MIMDIDEPKRVKLAEELEEFSRTTVIEADCTEECFEREISEADLLINASPVGMFPNSDASPVPKKFLHPDLHVFDIVYNPLETQLIQDAKEIGCPTLGGIDMLVNQGAIAFEWWTGQVPNKELMKQAAIGWLGL